MGVRWSVASPLRDRHVAALLEERGVSGDHARLQRGVGHDSPRWAEAGPRRPRAVGGRGRMDETDIRGTGPWDARERAVDQHGQTIAGLCPAKRSGTRQAVGRGQAAPGRAHAVLVHVRRAAWRRRLATGRVTGKAQDLASSRMVPRSGRKIKPTFPVSPCRFFATVSSTARAGGVAIRSWASVSNSTTSAAYSRSPLSLN